MRAPCTTRGAGLTPPVCSQSGLFAQSDPSAPSTCLPSRTCPTAGPLGRRRRGRLLGPVPRPLHRSIARSFWAR